MNLDYWQEKIYEHFKILHEIRAGTPNKNPVFALEHGFSAPDLDRLKAEVRAHVASNNPVERHWLTWVVYAAEIGYSYDGQEYWQTFEASTPGWARFRGRYRSWIRACFLRFRDEFRGAEPSGPWAEWFKNIAWPIRHAILPHYLQHQLAKALFNMRLFFREELFESPLALGNFIAAHYRTGTKLFQELLEDPLLVGQISTALLLRGHKISEDLLLKETQDRIVGDLGREQIEREWLESAQRQAVTTYEGLRRRAAAGITEGAPRGRGPIAFEERLRIENTPQLFLYPKANGKEWGLKLELQDLRSLAAIFREFEPVLAGNYCTVAGTSGYPQPRGMFLRPGPHAFALARWPSDTEVLIKFENAPKSLNALLMMDQLIPPGDVHLFKISSENIGYQIHGKHVRPGRKYVVISKLPIRHGGEKVFKPFPLQCEGINVASVDVPSEITSPFEQAMKDVGLNCAKSLRAWPVGLPAKEWDEEGYGVWLTGDNVRIAVKADYELRGVEVAINRDSVSFLSTPALSEAPVLLDLRSLPSGKNLVEIKAIAKQQPHEDLVGYLSAIVREPQVWDVRTANQGALRGFVDPETPSLEEIWTNDVNIEIYGPAGRSVGCRIRLLDRVGTSVVGEKKITDLTLPIHGERWRSEFTAKVKKDASMQEAYDVAQVGELFFDAEEMGYFTVSGERKSTPIRWAVHRSGRNKKLRYINETDAEGVSIARFEFATPDLSKTIQTVSHGQTVECADGGLLAIEGRDGQADSIVMSPYGRRMTPEEMRICPNLSGSYKGEEGVQRLIKLYDLWERSRASGNILSDLWRRRVLKCIAGALCSILGGSRWEKAEHEYLEKDDEASLGKLKICISDKPEERIIGAVLAKDAERLASLPVRTRQTELGRLIAMHLRVLEKKCGVDRVGEGGTITRTSPSHLLPEFILRLASAPNTLLGWDAKLYSILITHLQEFPVIARAGRFMVLVVDRQCAAAAERNGSCYRGWKWR